MKDWGGLDPRRDWWGPEKEVGFLRLLPLRHLEDFLFSRAKTAYFWRVLVFPRRPLQ